MVNVLQVCGKNTLFFDGYLEGLYVITNYKEKLGILD